MLLFQADESKTLLEILVAIGATISAGIQFYGALILKDLQSRVMRIEDKLIGRPILTYQGEGKAT